MSANYITVNDFAIALGVSRFRIYQLIERGKIPAEKIGHSLLIERAELNNYKTVKHGKLNWIHKVKELS